MKSILKPLLLIYHTKYNIFCTLSDRKSCFSPFVSHVCKSKAKASSTNKQNLKMQSSIGQNHSKNSYPYHRSDHTGATVHLHKILIKTLKLLINRVLGVTWFLDHNDCGVFNIARYFFVFVFLARVFFSLRHFGETLWPESTSVKHICGSHFLGL